MKVILFAITLLAGLPGMAQPSPGVAQTPSNPVQFINPPSVAAPHGYSHAAVIDLGNSKMVILSGQVPMDQQGNLVGAGDLGRQAEQAFQNIRNIVTAAGGTMDNIVKLGFFITDMSKLQALREARDKFINTKNPPASTLVQVSKLYRDDVLVEIEATAIIPKK